jgi:hypothetical protein
MTPMTHMIQGKTTIVRAPHIVPFHPQHKANRMDNQHRQIKGYRELSQSEIDCMNEIKTKGAELGELVDRLRRHGDALDQRWISIGATDLQTGLMALTRGVARPTFF